VEADEAKALRAREIGIDADRELTGALTAPDDIGRSLA